MLAMTKEFREFCIIFLGEILAEKISFRSPEATTHAHWMAKVFYSLKMFLLREKFKVTKTEMQALTQICVFILNIYVSSLKCCESAEYRFSIVGKFISRQVS